MNKVADIILMQDWTVNDLTLESPAIYFTDKIKKRVFIWLNMSEFDEYMSLSPEGRVQFLKKHPEFKF